MTRVNSAALAVGVLWLSAVVGVYLAYRAWASPATELPLGYVLSFLNIDLIWLGLIMLVVTVGLLKASPKSVVAPWLMTGLAVVIALGAAFLDYYVIDSLLTATNTTHPDLVATRTISPLWKLALYLALASIPMVNLLARSDLRRGKA